MMPIPTAYMRLALELERGAHREGLVATADAVVGAAKELILANRKVNHGTMVSWADLDAVVRRVNQLVTPYGMTAFATPNPGRGVLVLRLQNGSSLHVPL